LKALLAKQYGFQHWAVRPPLEETPAKIIDTVAKKMMAASE
jgi:hypothetical protein